MNMSKLPPLHNLPSWSRSSLERRKIQRSIAKDPVLLVKRTEALQSSNRSSSGNVGGRRNGSAGTSRNISAALSANGDEKTTSRKVNWLQNDIRFLQQQHDDTLSKLHEEIEKLKSENRGVGQRRLCRFACFSKQYISFCFYR